MRFPYAVAIFCCAVAATFGVSCDAELETGCVDGTCTGATTASGGVGGACAGDEHGLPCGVYDVLSNICQQCHVPGGMGPFPLLEYCDTQGIYGKKPIWVRMELAIKVDAFPRMPLGQDPLSDADMATMNAWFDTCGRDGSHEGEEGMGGATSYDFFQCAGAQNGPPPSCNEGGAGGAPAGGAPAGGAPAGGAPAGGAGGAGGI